MLNTARVLLALLAAACALAELGRAGAVPLGQQRALTSTGNQSAQQLAGAKIGAVARVKRDNGANKHKSNKQLAIECLAAHNKLRRKHKVPDLQWDDKLAAFAQKRSNHIADSDGAEFGHPPDLPYGENLFWHSSVDTATCDLMVRGWYDEIKLYSFSQPVFAAETGHFTQVVWRGTQRVGCALASSSGKRGGVYLTCSYDPAGNFVGEFLENVPRPFGKFGLPTLKPPALVAGLLPASTAGSLTTSAAAATATPATTSMTMTTGRPAQTGAEPKPDMTTKPKSKKKGHKKKKKGDNDKNKKKKKNKAHKKKTKNKKVPTTTQTPPSSTLSARASGERALTAS